MQTSGRKNKFDATILSQKILSCIYRLDQRFGMGYVIDILRGSKAKYINKDHEKLSTYGIVKDFSKEQLKDLVKQLVKLGYIYAGSDRYSTLKLAKKSAVLLKGKGKIFLRQPHNWFEIMKQNAQKYHITIEATLSLLQNGFTIEQAVEIRQITTQTVINHIELAAFLGKTTDITKFVETGKIKIIENTFKELGIEKLSPVKDRLGEEYSYDEIKLVRAKMLISSKH